MTFINAREVDDEPDEKLIMMTSTDNDDVQSPTIGKIKLRAPPPITTISSRPPFLISKGYHQVHRHCHYFYDRC